MAKSPKVNKGAAQQLRWYQMLLVRLLALLMGAWTRTLRFRWDEATQAFLDAEHPPSVVILWHNRLFVAPAFFRRYFKQRKLAVLISASGDGAWLSAFLKQVGMHPVRGSRYNRGPQAVRELIEASKQGHDIGITPDGSRGPIYDMKPGAVTVAMKTNTPIVLLSFNFGRAWRLKSWDKFFLPHPFTTIEAKLESVGMPEHLGTDDASEAAAILKQRMDAITEDEA